MVSHTGVIEDWIIIFSFHHSSLQELEDFEASEVGGKIQGKDHYKDTRQVKEILEMQTKLKELTNEYIHEHHKPDTFDMSEIF